jgi:hypothetical protein
MKNKVIIFFDHGQDFSHWLVMADGQIADCEPFQFMLWTKERVTNLSDCFPGGRVKLADAAMSDIVSRYAIKDVFETEQTNIRAALFDLKIKK